jgi:NAD(P)-dependent dehydrogenase (short-subunit alcohol dehydrogenase family)
MVFPDFSLKGKVAVVTGGTRGMGRAMALTFARAGADVAVTSRHHADADKVTREIRELGRRGLGIEADSSSASDAERLVKGVISEFGSLDILVNNAAVNVRKGLLETSEQEWDLIHGVDLKGVFLCAQAAAKVMIPKRQGTIINITSVGAKKPVATTGAYTVAKAGVVMLTKVLAIELLPHNIRVHGIGPGPVRTEFNKELWVDPKKRAEYEAKLPLKRFAEADEISGIALLLASDAASYMTGQTVYFDGGVLL